MTGQKKVHNSYDCHTTSRSNKEAEIILVAEEAVLTKTLELLPPTP